MNALYDQVPAAISLNGYNGYVYIYPTLTENIITDQSNHRGY